MHFHILRRLSAIQISRFQTSPCDPDFHFHLQLGVRIITISNSLWRGFSRYIIHWQAICAIQGRSQAIESCLSGFNRTLPIDFTGSGLGFLLFYVFVLDSFWDYVDQKLEIVKVRDSASYEFVRKKMETGDKGEIQRSRYWMLRRGFRSDLTTL